MSDGSDYNAIAHRTRQTVLWIQIGEAILLVCAAIAIVVLVITVYNDRAKIGRQQQIIAAQQVALARLTATQVAEAHRVSTALCDSQFTIATAPLPPNATKLGVEFVEASRKAFVVLQCRGILGAPSKSLLTLGKRLGVLIRY